MIQEKIFMSFIEKKNLTFIVCENSQKLAGLYKDNKKLKQLIEPPKNSEYYQKICSRVFVQFDLIKGDETGPLLVMKQGVQKK